MFYGGFPPELKDSEADREEGRHCAPSDREERPREKQDWRDSQGDGLSVAGTSKREGITSDGKKPYRYVEEM